MPFTSDRQRRAMHAAAAGRSTLGIPRAVAKRFIAHAEDEPQTIVDLAKRRKKGRRR